MPRPPRFPAMPDLTRKAEIDRHLDRLDTQFVSRRDFLSLASAGVAATAAGTAIGRPAVAVADPSGKLAYLAWTTRVEYLVQASKAIKAACKALTLRYTLLARNSIANASSTSLTSRS